MIIIDDDGIMHKVFTKADIVAMLTELQMEIEEHKMISGVTNQGTWNECVACCSKVIQYKIDALKEHTHGEISLLNT